MSQSTSNETQSTEHFDVVVVGAGLSGICAAHYLKTKCPWANFTILEARQAIGGTWDLFRYPGIRSDSDMFTFSYSFRPWQHDNSIGSGEAIRTYIQDTAMQDGTDKLIEFSSRVTAANWSSHDRRWTLTVQHSDASGMKSVREITTGFLFSCAGYYRYDRGYQAEIPGISNFEGPVVHPQFWPEDLDYADRNVVVIGSGATAVTLVPSMAPMAKHVTMLQRTPTYIASLPPTSKSTKLVRRLAPKSMQGAILKWMNLAKFQGSYWVSRKRPAAMKRFIRRGLEAMVPPEFDIDQHLTPPYDPWDQRLCLVPDGDLFRQMRDGKVSIITDTIKGFTSSGIQLSSGQELPTDLVVTATGLEVSFLGGVEVTVDSQPFEISHHMCYRGMMLEDLPNLAIAMGYTNASWTLKAELTCKRVAATLNFMRERGFDTCTPANVGEVESEGSLLGLSSGYIRRAEAILPRQGAKDPWRIHQYYIRDLHSLRNTQIDDGVLQFSTAVRQAQLSES